LSCPSRSPTLEEVMRRFPLLLAFLVALSLLALGGPSGSAPKKGDGWVPLFNGKDLDGWSTYFDGRARNGKTDDLVRVEDGVIHLYPTGADGEARPAGYLATDKAYSYYQLRFEYKWGDKRSAPRAGGLMYHVVGPDRLWPRGLECRLDEGHVG